MGFLDVVKWNAVDNETIAMKFATPRHDDQFNTGSRLIVSTGQEAVVVINGEMTGPFGPSLEGHVMNTKNLPILTNIIKKVAYFGNTPYPADVWFVQVASAPDFGWGTQDPVEVGIPYSSNGMMLEFTAQIVLYGSMEIAIRDTMTFMKRVVQTKPFLTRSDLRTILNAKLMQILKPTLAKLLRTNQVSIRDIVFSQDIIAQLTFEAFAEQVKGYGLELLSFNVESVKLTPETASRVNQLDNKAMAVAGESMERNVLGLSRKEELQMDVLKKLASNQGAGVTMAPMMGMGLGMGMAGKMSAEMAKMAQSVSMPNPSTPPPIPSKKPKYHIHVNDQNYGPYSLDQIRQWVSSGSITLKPDTLVWCPGMSEWKPCSDVQDFAELLNSTPPPPPLR